MYICYVLTDVMLTGMDFTHVEGKVKISLSDHLSQFVAIIVTSSFTLYNLQKNNSLLPAILVQIFHVCMIALMTSYFFLRIKIYVELMNNLPI